MTVAIPPDTDQRIRDGHYPPCRHCNALGVTYRPERNDAGYHHAADYHHTADHYPTGNHKT